MNCLMPSTLSMKYHLLCHGLKVSVSLLSTSVMEVRFYSTLGDALSHSFAVLKNCFVFKSSVSTVVLLPIYV